ncbi:MAG: 1,4-alpha-glucan branching protein GlgB [Acidobacteria bacterium]|nr:1,4-alpha-glucan branching protein GlgB [Acidobacteriota bacterium]
MTQEFSLLSADDLHLFNSGGHYRLYNKLGAHPSAYRGAKGVGFAVWAPDAVEVSVMGDFNGWAVQSSPLLPRDQSGIWEGFVPGAAIGDRYKFHIVSRHGGYRVDKADPFAFFTEVPPERASRIWDLEYGWNDREWMENRAHSSRSDRPMSIYEVHMGSWRRVPEDGCRSLSYLEMASRLPAYVKEMGFTHVELLPVMEHPFFGSWGYQTSGYFAPSARYGTPQDFMALVDAFHAQGIGVILDWVPSHFPADEHGLGFFDGTHLYEHADPRQGRHKDWDTLVFNYDRHEVQSFLASSAHFWLDRYHADGLRVDAVASMLYLDYSRQEGEWIPNVYGGRENLGAIQFLRSLNESLYREHPDVQTIAEESTAWPMVSRPTYLGGLGFGMKWDMGWMHDTLSYMSLDPVHRRYHHDKLTFRGLYMFTENFLLPLSHDEVVHGKGSLLGKMPGDDWCKFANLRLLLGYLYAQPGKKLLFMGGEFGQWNEWAHDASLDWNLLEYEPHRGMKRWVQDLNRLYREEPALHRLDFHPEGFRWIDCSDTDGSVVSLLRRGDSGRHDFLVVGNFTPVPRSDYRVGVPREGYWKEALNSDARLYGGSGIGNMGGLETAPVPLHNQPFSLALTLPPLAILFFRCER